METNTLPTSLKIAAECKALDKVCILNNPYTTGSHAYHRYVKVLKIGDWEKRLINKSVKVLTKEINRFCKMSVNKPIFTPYQLSNIKESGIYVYNEIIYDLVSN